MRRFPEVGGTTARRIDRIIGGLSRSETLEVLEQNFIGEVYKIMPADCMCWNNWAPDMSGLLSFSINSGYERVFSGLLDVFSEVVANHPVIASGQLEVTTSSVMRISDFESHSRFKENPLFREVYRHLDSHFQICYTASVLEDRRIVLTWNRRAFDFSEKDRQVFHYMGMRLGVISRLIEERQRLDLKWQTLCGFVDPRLGAGSVEALGRSEVDLLTGLLKRKSRGVLADNLGIRRDSIDKQLGSIRERLGLENHHQLLGALAEFKNLG